MKVYLLSLGAGLLVGVIYALLQVKSPAPPAIALLGLLGMLMGEQLVPIVKRAFSEDPLTVGWIHRECAPKVLGVPNKADSSSADVQ